MEVKRKRHRLIQKKVGVYICVCVCYTQTYTFKVTEREMKIGREGENERERQRQEEGERECTPHRPSLITLPSMHSTISNSHSSGAGRWRVWR